MKLKIQKNRDMKKNKIKNNIKVKKSVEKKSTKKLSLPKAKKFKKFKKVIALDSKKDQKVLKKVDRMEISVKKLISKGKEKGFVTYDEILKEFPDVENDIIFLDELYDKFSASGIDILEGGGLLWLSPRCGQMCLSTE